MLKLVLMAIGNITAAVNSTTLLNTVIYKVGERQSFDSSHVLLTIK